MKTLILILTLAFSIDSFSQNDHLKYAAFNVITNSIIGGIGSGIHHRDNETFFHAFGQGAWKGALGGVTNYYGMRLVEVSAGKDNLNYIWPGRIVNALGSSITYNAVANDKIWSSFNMNVFCFNVRYNGKIHLRVDPLSLGYAGVLAFTKDMKFNFRNSLLTGSILFEKYIDVTNYIDHKKDYGLAIGNTFFIKNSKNYFYNYDKYKEYLLNKSNISNSSINIICHELIHTFQYEQFSSLNLLSTDKICKSLKTNINQYLYINPNFGLIYLLNNINYTNNIFEFESDLFSKCNYFTKDFTFN